MRKRERERRVNIITGKKEESKRNRGRINYNKK